MNCIMARKPLISVITITYNSASHVEEAIQSVLGQGYENLEYIVIDGGSTDATIDIINKYKNQIAYFVSEPDKGISDAFNKGIAAANGDLIGIINSDDKLEANALNVVAENYDESVDMYRGNCYIWNDSTGYLFVEKPTLYWPAIPVKMRAGHPATFVSRKAYQKYGCFDTDLKYAMDTDLFRRFSAKNAVVKHIDTVLAYFRLGGVSQSSEKKRRRELKYILKKNGSNVFQVFLFDCYYRLRMFVKHIVSLFGEDFRFKLVKKY